MWDFLLSVTNVRHNLEHSHKRLKLLDLGTNITKQLTCGNV